MQMCNDVKKKELEGIISNYDAQSNSRFGNISYLTEGREFVIFSVGEDSIARISKKKKDIAPMKREEKYLNALHNVCSASTRDILPTAETVNDEYPFFICKKIKGTDMGEGGKIDRRDMKKLMTQLAHAIADIHGAAKKDNSILDNLTPLKGPKKEDVMTTLKERLSKDDFQRVEDILEKNDLDDAKQVSLHSDLNPRNIMISDDHKKITGLIDVGLLKGDYHLDLSRIKLNLNDEVLWKAFKKNYEKASLNKVNEDRINLCGILKGYTRVKREIENNGNEKELDKAMESIRAFIPGKDSQKDRGNGKFSNLSKTLAEKSSKAKDIGNNIGNNIKKAIDIYRRRSKD